MSQPIQEYLEQALEDFETYLRTQPTKMARFTHAELEASPEGERHRAEQAREGRGVVPPHRFA